MKRRFFLFAAPAIVAAPSLMRVSAAALVPPPAMQWVWLEGSEMEFTARDLTISVEEFSAKCLRPQMIALANHLDTQLKLVLRAA